MRFAFGIGQVVPLLEQQHLEADQRIVGGLAGGAVQRRPVAIECRPVDQPGDFHEKVLVGNMQFQRFVAKGFLRLDATQQLSSSSRSVDKCVISKQRPFVRSYAEVSCYDAALTRT